jgi:RimJ/RimL family protein N-acetyltransferase
MESLLRYASCLGGIGTSNLLQKTNRQNSNDRQKMLTNIFTPFPVLKNTIEDARKFIHKIAEVVKQNEGIYWAITLTNKNNLVGRICLFNFSNENDQAEIGYELLPAFQVQRIMQEETSKVSAFGIDVTGLKAIKAYTTP